MRPSHFRRRTAGLLAAVAAGFTIAFGVAGPAAADASLVSSSPGNGASVAVAPPAVTFTFNELVQARLTTVTVTDAQGGAVPVAPVLADRATVIQPLPPGLAPGGYVAAYRIVSADGHPVTGQIRFTVAPAPSAGAAPAPVDNASAAADIPLAAVDEPAAIPADPVVARQPADGQGAGTRGWPWVAGAALVLVCVTGTAVVRHRHRTALP